MVSEVIPFGKYKGQPAEAMAADRQYVEWLMAQSWFRDKYQNIYTLIVNNFTEPSETPEHNALQALFLSNEFCMRCVSVAYPEKVITEKMIRDIAEWYINDGYNMRYGNRRDVLEYSDVRFVFSISVEFEVGGADVRIEMNGHLRGDIDEYVEAQHGSYGWRRNIDRDALFWVEVKPSIGDDYPAVLRQMRAVRIGGLPVLFVGEYCGVGATREQFVEIFKRAGIAVLFKADVT